MDENSLLTPPTVLPPLPPSYDELYPPEPQFTPTVVPNPNFEVRTDLLVLTRALGFNESDKKAIVNLLANRSHLQRLEMAELFKAVKGKDFTEMLKLVLIGDFKNLVVAMMTPFSEFYAKELHRAMAGPGTNETVLIDILCTLSKSEIQAVRRSYQKMYKTTLDDDLRDDTSGNFKRFMISLCCANRDESSHINSTAAMNDATKLFQASKGPIADAELLFSDIFVRRNACQLKQIFQNFQTISGHNIQFTINRKFSGDLKKGLIAILRFVENRPGFLAEKLYKSTHGITRDDRRLIRLVVTRSEVDMGEIKQVFTQQYGQSLEHLISVETSGYYKKCLLALVTPGPSILP